MASRPDRATYYMSLAFSVAARAECRGLKVGAVLVRDNRVISTGYNGAPEGGGNCSDGDVCVRCDNRDAFGSGNGYDLCICVHAEANAITAAARYGMAVDGATAYVTHQPCFSCAKELIQAGVGKVYYTLEWPIPRDHKSGLGDELNDAHSRLMGQLKATAIQQGAVEATLQTVLDELRPARDTRPTVESEAA